MRSLNEYEKSELETRLKKSKDLSEWKRIFAMIGYDGGQSIEELADLLRVSTDTVESYLRDYNFNKKLRKDPGGGSQSKLTAEESEKLEKHLVERTYEKNPPPMGVK